MISFRKSKSRCASFPLCGRGEEVVARGKARLMSEKRRGILCEPRNASRLGILANLGSIPIGFLARVSGVPTELRRQLRIFCGLRFWFHKPLLGQQWPVKIGAATFVGRAE